MNICKIEKCSKKVKGLGFCQMHYQRLKLTGDTGNVEAKYVYTNDPKTLLDKKHIKHKSGCWLWTGYINKEGYGRVGFQGKIYAPHRLAYSLYIGEIPEGYTIDHDCHNKNLTCKEG